MNQEKRNSKSTIRLPLFIAAAISLGIFIGANMTDGSPTVEDMYKSMYKFRQVLTHINSDYVDEVNTEELVEEAIVNMLEKLDPHSVYIPAEQLALTQSQLEGNFEGIGIEFNIFKDTIYVVTPLSGGPSESLGIQPGDKIVRVDGKNVAGIGMTNQKVIGMLRGEKGSKVKVHIQRKGVEELLSFDITRDVIPQYSVDVSYMVGDEIGYIKVSRFAATTYMEFKEALAKLQESGMKKLILDFTGNPGGYMDQAVKMVDELLQDDQLIVYTQGKDPRHNSEYFSEIEGDFEKGSLVILIDEGTASAPEIVSGAVQDHDRGIIVGRRSFGKGLVQRSVPLNDGSALRLTISRYYTPSGRCIQKPYGESPDDYHMEYYERFQNGEVYSADSIKVNDSLTYKTDGGRTVYGGGGIMPDYFVALDTAANSRYLTRLFNSNTIAEFSLKYAEENRESLEKQSFGDYRRNFQPDESTLNDLIALGKQNGVELKPKEFERSLPLLRIYTKAFVARNIWGNEGFYPIFNEQNEIFQKAISLVDEADDLAIK